MAKSRSKRAELVDEDRLKIEGRLRSIVDSSPKVNAVRAASLGGLRLSAKMRDMPAMAFESEMVPKAKKETQPEKGTSNEAAIEEIDIQGFVVLASETSELDSPLVTGRRGRVCTVCGSQESIRRLALKKEVISIRLADSVRSPNPEDGSISDRVGNAERPPQPRFERSDRFRHGENVLIGIIDVGGFDFAHPDFLDSDGRTRFVSIWDQAEGGFRDPPSARNPFRVASSSRSTTTAQFDYGSELVAENLNAAISESRTAGLPAYELEPQSQMVRGSHATHVASIAAGNGSFCGRAKIAGVLLALAPEDSDRRRSFYDTTRIAHAIEYLLKLADVTEGVDAVSINISLGTNGGPHDDSSPMSRWIDFALTTPGRAVCVAAGNAGQEAPRQQGDIGFTLGRIHTSGRLAATELENELDWIVVGDGNRLQDVSENELEVWYPPQDRFAVQIRPPGGSWLPVVEPGQFIQNKVLGGEHNFTVISVYNELYDAGNGHNRITVYVSPFISDNGIRSIAPGTWKVRLIGRHVRDGRYHGWIERDDPVEIDRIGERSFWRFPSFFADGTNVDNSSLSTLACGDRIVAVANLDSKNRRINISSSQGPTRDGREKPDIAAPGTEIWAANGFDSEPWIQKTGTSMASPFAASVAGLILSIAPQLTASQVLGIIRRSAKPLPGHSYDWRDDAGFGEIDVDVCLQEARKANLDLEDIEISESNEGGQ